MQEKESEFLEFVITESDRQDYKRLDQYLCEKIGRRSRSYIKSMFEQNLISSETKLSLSKMPVAGTSLCVEIPSPKELKAIPQDLPLEILFEDAHILIVNKAAGMVTHPAPGNYDGTLVNAVLFHCKDLTGIGGTLRPGIVHRLDKGTSGVMVVAKSQEAMDGLIPQFADHSIHRIYEALVIGQPKEKKGSIETIIGRSKNNRLKMTSKLNEGKKAITHFEVLKYYECYSHMRLKLETGRTHQIRVHLSEKVQCPILCDQTYGNPSRQIKHFNNKETIEHLKSYPHPFLHAKELGLTHPVTKEALHFSAPVPKEFQRLL